MSAIPTANRNPSRGITAFQVFLRVYGALSNIFGRRSNPGGIAAAHDDVRALVGEKLGGGVAEAGARAGHERDIASESQVHGAVLPALNQLSDPFALELAGHRCGPGERRIHQHE